ncbi:MAG: hypothetical protein FJZ10_05905 [Candidatus Omnitrophica bacterium]|nr:hypothetical protein [Candidatus Omnitrophota bacterium]
MKNLLLFITVFLSLACFNVFAQGEQLGAEAKNDSNSMATYNADVYRDPFIPVIKKEEAVSQQGGPETGAIEVAPPEFDVKGMIWNTDSPQAIIDGKILRLGDEVKDAKIIEISKEGVKLLFRGRVITAKPKIGK